MFKRLSNTSITISYELYKILRFKVKKTTYSVGTYQFLRTDVILPSFIEQFIFLLLLFVANLVVELSTLPPV